MRSNDETNLKHCIEESVLAFCGQAGLFAPTETTRVIVAVSGGADSMALLRILMALQTRLGVEISACHVNHGLRGKAADADEAFVRGECARLGVPLAVFRAEECGMPVPENAGEEWARRLRYRCFASLLAGPGAVIATAHTKTDQAETLLFRLARGTGVHGAAGILPQRPGFVRPVLCLTRAETEAYCAAAGQPFVQDETNASDAYARNRLRHYALPALRQANAAAEENISSFCDKMRRTDEYFSRCAGQLLAACSQAEAMPLAGPWRLEPLQKADTLILEAAMHRLVSPLRDAEEKYIILLREMIYAGRGAVQITDFARFTIQGCWLFLQKESAPNRRGKCSGEMFGRVEFPLQEGEYRFPGGYRVKIRVFSRKDSENIPIVHKKDLKNCADYATIKVLALQQGEALLRTRNEGDRFTPLGRGLTKPLKKWMNEERIPPEERQRLPLLAIGGQVLWICGGGCAEQIAAGSGTTELLVFEVCKTEEETQ